MASDVFVIGGGPAGLAAAIAARRKGLTATVADGAAPPIDKACGEGLMPDGMAALRDLGVQISGANAHPFHGIRFVGEGVSVAGDFPVGCGLGVRRTVLHARMIEEAEAAGVRLLWSTAVTGLRHNGVVAGGQVLPARWIIGADGLKSRVRRWAGLAENGPAQRRYGFRTHYGVRPWSRHMELHWGDGCQIYVTPVGAREVCVALISHDSRLRLREALAQFPEVSARLAGATVLSAEAGAVTANYILPRVHNGHVALIGDASGGVDAITGEGLCLAFQQAVALADCLAGGDLAAYQAEHRRIRRRPMLMAKLMLALDRSSALRHVVLRTMAWQPSLFSKILSLHVSGPRRIRALENAAATLK